MAPDEYTKALDLAMASLEQKLLQRDLLTAQIAGDKETVRILSSRITLSHERKSKIAQLLALVDSATPSLTDAIRSLLTREHPKEMTAVEVRNELESSQTFEDSNISLSSCHAALKRLFSEGEVELGAEKNGKTTYRRVLLMPDLGFSNLRALSTLGGKLPRIASPSSDEFEYPPVIARPLGRIGGKDKK